VNGEHCLRMEPEIDGHSALHNQAWEGRQRGTVRCHCDYCVRTKEFDHRNGNVRTQAATAMIEHQASEHRGPVLAWATRSTGIESV